MEETKFKMGETVRLKSGGPLMTIDSVEKKGDQIIEYTVVWFDSQRKEMRSQFKEKVLEKDDGGPVIA